MKKLLFLLVLICTNVFAGSYDPIVKVAPGHTYAQALTELNAAGWTVTSTVDPTTFGFTVAKPTWTFIYNGTSHTIPQLLSDPLHTNAESEALYSALIIDLGGMAHVDFVAVVEPGVLDTYVWTSLPNHLVINGITTNIASKSVATPTTIKTAMIDLDYVIDTEHPEALTDFVKTQIYETPSKKAYEKWLHQKVDLHATEMADVISQIYATNMNLYAVAEGGALDHAKAVYRAIEEGNNTITSAYTTTAFTDYDPLNANHVNTSTSTAAQRTVMDAYETAWDKGLFVVQSFGNKKLLPEWEALAKVHPEQVPFPYTNDMVDWPRTTQSIWHIDSDKVFFVGESTGVNDTIVSPCSPLSEPATVDGFINTSYAQALGFTISGTSPASYTVGGVVNSIRDRYGLTNTQMRAALVNSTKIANNTTVKDRCRGWGKVNAAAVENYVTTNYPQQVCNTQGHVTSVGGTNYSNTSADFCKLFAAHDGGPNGLTYGGTPPTAIGGNCLLDTTNAFAAAYVKYNPGVSCPVLPAPSWIPYNGVVTWNEVMPSSTTFVSARKEGCVNAGGEVKLNPQFINDPVRQLTCYKNNSGFAFNIYLNTNAAPINGVDFNKWSAFSNGIPQ